MINEEYAKLALSSGAGGWQTARRLVGTVATVIALCPVAVRAQSTDPTPPVTPLSSAQSAKLNKKVAAAEASGTELPSQIVSDTFTGTITGIVDDRSVRIHRDDKNRDETVSLYGVRTFGTGPMGGKDAQAYLASHVKGAHVKVEARSRNSNGVLSALVTAMPQASPTLVAPPTIDGSGAGRDFPQNADAPSVPSTPPSVNFALLRLGLARFDVRQLKDAPDLSGAEGLARKEKKGYWADTTVAAN